VRRETEVEQKFTVGQKVKVFDVNGPRMGMPVGGWDAVVTKVGRKLVTVKHEGEWGIGEQYRMEDGQANDGWGHRSIKTLEQADDSERRSRATVVLRKAGIETYRVRLTATQLEAIVAILEPQDEEVS
jgi:hypothetical protein